MYARAMPLLTNATRVTLVALVLVVATCGHAIAACRPCAFGGLCPTDGETLAPCTLSESRCIPRNGILGFNSDTGGPPAYWTLFAEFRGRGPFRRLEGRLGVWADYSFAPPAVPGLPAQCEVADRICSGTSAHFSGRIRRDRFVGTARYPDGATCRFRTTVAFGLGDALDNTYVCRSASGTVRSQGRVRMQLIRLQGCRARSVRSYGATTTVSVGRPALASRDW